MKSTRFFVISLLFIFFLLSACQTASEIKDDGSFSSSTSTLQLPSTLISTPTSKLPDSLIPDSTLQTTPDAMRFSLPTPGAQPVTAWRPPLYPVPWASSPYDHFYFTRPISVDQINWQNLDYRYGGIFFKPSAVHTGIDIPAKLGTIVLATGPGEVVWAGWGLYTGDPVNEDDPYGLAVVILHDFGYQDHPLYTVYAHLKQVDVITGQWLQTGDVLGKVGETGFTTGPHLHFEVRIGENTYFNTSNPELWLVQPQGRGVLAARITDSYDNAIPDLDVSLISNDSEMEWNIQTYPQLGTLGDEYYQENLVMSDLPAGEYTLSFQYLQITQEKIIKILPGEITYFTFRGLLGFGTTPPPTDKTNFLYTATP